jgi:hypothetical protein
LDSQSRGLGGDVDDSPETGRLHRRQRGVGAGKGRDQIDGEELSPIIRGGVGEECVLIDAGIVDDNIERSVVQHDLLYHTGVGDIELRGGRADLPGEIGSTGDIEIADDDVGAGGSKRSHNGSPDALGSAGNESAAAVEPSEGQGTGVRHFSASRERRLAPFDHRGESLAGVGGAG